MSDSRDAAERSPGAVTLWAPFPGPLGGVTLSAVRLEEWLQGRDIPTRSVDLRDRRAILTSLARARPARHLFWCATLQSVGRHSVLARLTRGERWLFVHGGEIHHGSVGALGRRLSAFERIFATNAELVAFLTERGAARAELASAHIPLSAPGCPARAAGMVASPRAVVAVGHNLEWYGLELAIATVEALRDGAGDATLTVLHYGSGILPSDLPGWVTVRGDVSPQQVPSVLASHDVLLRPSRVDGDALIVREALDLGLEVVATDVVPRPRGVRLAPPEPDALADAVRHGGRVSCGAGLGPPITSYLVGAA